MADRSDYVMMAKMAEQAERYEDMVAQMKMVAMTAKDTPLTYDERNLLSVAYKNVVGAKRSSWRMLYNHEQQNGSENHKPLVKEYKEEIEKELQEVCDEVVQLLDEHLIPSCESDNESKVFFLKMKGDYYRYLAEVNQKYQKDSKTAYNEALELSKGTMEPANPIRLGLALNFSVFHYEIVRSRNEACKLAREAFDEAKAQMNTENDAKDVYKDSKLIMQLLRDNLTLWVSENTEEGEDAAEQTTQD